VGDGPDRASLETHAAQLGLSAVVRFTGWVNQDHLAAMHEKADIFVLASFGEGIPVVLMEAMAMELPVIATWVAGVPELVDHGRNGLLCPPGDAGALAGAVVKLARDGALRRRLGAAGRRAVIERYDLTTNVRRLAQCFTDRGLLSEEWSASEPEPLPVNAAAVAS
jgi:glycosyltransferase involved in cell wall biosynthesis